MNDLSLAAKGYLKSGFSVFPCGIDKRPLTLNGFKAATADWDVVARWWEKNPSASIGIPTGKGFFVLDVDLPDGPAALKKLEVEFGPLPGTLQQETGGGGKHYFFRMPEGATVRNSAGKLGPNLDIRGEGGYVIFPPSWHPSGNRYRFLNNLPIVEPPAWLVKLISDQLNSTKADGVKSTLLTARPYGLAALDNELGKIAAAEEGCRNDTLNKSAYSLGQLVAGGEIDRGHVFESLFNVAVSVGLTKAEARKTIVSGLNSGNKEPRTAPQQGKTSQNTAEVGKAAQHTELPLLFDDYDTPAISPMLLPGWMGEYVEAVARSTQTPPAMAVMLALATVATCTAKRFEVSPYGEGYAEPLNLWTATALPPASRKTAVISAMTAPLNDWEITEAERLEKQIIEATVARKIAEKRIEKLEKSAANVSDPNSRNDIRKEILQLRKDMPEEILEPRLWTGDTTPERLQSLLMDQGERMAVLTDEGGIFEIMSGLYSDGRVNLDIFLQGHAGKAVRVDRQGRTAHLHSPALSFGLAIQPSILADFGTGRKRRFRGNGTLARFLYAIPCSNIGQRDVRAIYKIPGAVAAKYRNGIFGLLSIPPQQIEGRENARRLVLTPDALDSWLAFSEDIEKRQGPDGDLEGIQDWSGKLPGAALRIAGNFHLVKHGPSPPDQIEAATIEPALDLCSLLIDHAKAAFAMMETDSATGDAKAILKWITTERLRLFRRGDAYRHFKGRFTGKTDRLDKALGELLKRNMVAEAVEKTGGRPATAFLVNPYLLDVT